MPAARKTDERCPRCGDNTAIWVYEKDEPTITKAHYTCEACECEWTEVRQD
jgi:DNA-directed RNA polymerase subunit M/transcription elongation factor TFIIS